MRAGVERRYYFWHPKRTIQYTIHFKMTWQTNLSCLQDDWNEGSDRTSDGYMDKVSYALRNLHGCRSGPEDVVAFDVNTPWHCWLISLRCGLKGEVVSSAYRMCPASYTSCSGLNLEAAWSLSVMHSIAVLWTGRVDKQVCRTIQKLCSSDSGRRGSIQTLTFSMKSCRHPWKGRSFLSIIQG